MHIKNALSLQDLPASGRNLNRVCVGFFEGHLNYRVWNFKMVFY